VRGSRFRKTAIASSPGLAPRAPRTHKSSLRSKAPVLAASLYRLFLGRLRFQHNLRPLHRHPVSPAILSAGRLAESITHPAVKMALATSLASAAWARILIIDSASAWPYHRLRQSARATDHMLSDDRAFFRGISTCPGRRRAPSRHLPRREFLPGRGIDGLRLSSLACPCIRVVYATSRFNRRKSSPCG